MSKLVIKLDNDLVKAVTGRTVGYQGPLFVLSLLKKKGVHYF